MNDRIPPLYAERAALDELDDADREALARRGITPDELEAERQRLHADRVRLPGWTFRTRSRPALWLLPSTAALALALFFTVQSGNERIDQTIETTRLKGQTPQLLVHRRTPSGVERLASGAHAERGDVLQLTYTAAGRAHGVIVSIDGDENVTLHHPSQPLGSTRLEGGGSVALPFAYELDGARSYERFFFVTSAEPIDVTAVMARARELAAAGRAASAPLPISLEQTSVFVEKP